MAANYNGSTEPDCVPWERWRPAGGLENRLSQRTASRRDAGAPRRCRIASGEKIISPEASSASYD